MEILAKRLKWLRELQRYSQKDIAKKIGMTASGYQKIEYDERDPKLDVLVKLSAIHNVSTDFLLGVSDLTNDMVDLTYRLDRIKTYSNVKRLDFVDSMFNQKDEVRDELEREINKLEGEYRDCLGAYIKQILTVPDVDLENDEWIMGSAPYNYNKIKNAYTNKWEIILSDSSGHEILIYDFDSEEEMNSEFQSIINLLERIDVYEKYRVR